MDGRKTQLKLGEPDAVWQAQRHGSVGAALTACEKNKRNNTVYAVLDELLNDALNAKGGQARLEAALSFERELMSGVSALTAVSHAFIAMSACRSSAS